MILSKILRLLRIHQYIKNVFLFLPLFFGLEILNFELLIQVLFAFLAFSITASSIYILNDFKDLEKDRLHPTKKFRPLASNEVSVNFAIKLFFILAIFGHSIMSLISLDAFIILNIYFLINIAYIYKLKNIPILDVSLISLGFVIRLFLGAVIGDIELSNWIVLMTFLLALFISLAKRRDDVLIYNNTKIKSRKEIENYNLKFLDVSITVISSVLLVSYIMYITSFGKDENLDNGYLYLTIFFVILGVLRYLKIIFVDESSGSPTKTLLKDTFLQFTVFAWIITFYLFLY